MRLTHLRVSATLCLVLFSLKSTACSAQDPAAEDPFAPFAEQASEDAENGDWQYASRVESLNKYLAKIETELKRINEPRELEVQLNYLAQINFDLTMAMATLRTLRECVDISTKSSIATWPERDSQVYRLANCVEDLREHLEQRLNSASNPKVRQRYSSLQLSSDLKRKHATILGNLTATEFLRYTARLKRDVPKATTGDAASQKMAERTLDLAFDSALAPAHSPGPAATTPNQETSSHSEATALELYRQGAPRSVVAQKAREETGASAAWDDDVVLEAAGIGGKAPMTKEKQETLDALARALEGPLPPAPLVQYLVDTLEANPPTRAISIQEFWQKIPEKASVTEHVVARDRANDWLKTHARGTRLFLEFEKGVYVHLERGKDRRYSGVISVDHYDTNFRVYDRNDARHGIKGFFVQGLDEEGAEYYLALRDKPAKLTGILHAAHFGGVVNSLILIFDHARIELAE